MRIIVLAIILSSFTTAFAKLEEFHQSIRNLKHDSNLALEKIYAKDAIRDGAPEYEKVYSKFKSIVADRQSQFIAALDGMNGVITSKKFFEKWKPVLASQQGQYHSTLKALADKLELTRLVQSCFTKVCVSELSQDFTAWKEQVLTLNRNIKVNRFRLIKKIENFQLDINSSSSTLISDRVLFDRLERDELLGKQILARNLNEYEELFMRGQKIGLLNLRFYGLVRSNLFGKYGSVTHVMFRPVGSPLDFKYDVLYYIPESLKGKKNLKTLIFLHGGGSSTQTRSGSLNVARSYMNNLKDVADSLGVVLVAPSGSSINWGGHIHSYLRSLTRRLRVELPIDPNKIALSGHSMGGMGITRNAHWFADDYAFFMPTAAGMAERHQTERHLRTYFNLKYYHLQGRYDHFQSFITLCNKQKAKLEELEEQYGRLSGFTLDFYNGGHNYPKQYYESLLKSQFDLLTRDLFQKELFGMFYGVDKTHPDGHTGIEFYIGPRSSYYWLEAIEYEEEKKVSEFTAKITDNLITIDIQEGVKALRVYLSKKMIDFSLPLKVIVNDEVLFDGKVDKIDGMSTMFKKLIGEQFDSYIDLKL